MSHFLISSSKGSTWSAPSVTPGDVQACFLLHIHWVHSHKTQALIWRWLTHTKKREWNQRKNTCLPPQSAVNSGQYRSRRGPETGRDLRPPESHSVRQITRVHGDFMRRCYRNPSPVAVLGLAWESIPHSAAEDTAAKKHSGNVRSKLFFLLLLLLLATKLRDVGQWCNTSAWERWELWTACINK